MKEKKNNRFLGTVKRHIRFPEKEKWYCAAITIFTAVAVFCTIYAFIIPVAATEKTQVTIADETTDDEIIDGETITDETTDNKDETLDPGPGDTDGVLVSEDDGSMMAEKAEAAGRVWGYNDDGSIWWSNITVESMASDAIETGMPYVISGSVRRNVLTDTSMDDSTMQTAQPSSNGYQQYAIWYFEQAEDPEAGYRIYMVNSTGTDKKYLNLNKTALSLVDTSENASVFTVGASPLEEYPSCVTIQTGGYYINTYGQDLAGCRGWGGWNEADAGSCLQILKVVEDKQTANRIKTETSPNTVINLFDYWISDNQTDPDNVDRTLDNGINKNHVFKFSRGDVTGSSTEEAYLKLNNWTGAGQNPLQGIVQNKLGTAGYPVLSEKYNVTGYPETESLEYLFNPESEHEGKISYRNVKGLLSIDSQGYYSFSSKKNMAEFKEGTNSFLVYD